MKTIFVSSTFVDLQKERDAIRDFIAPAINEEAEKHGEKVDFQDSLTETNLYQNLEIEDKR